MIIFAVQDLLRPSWVQGTNAHISMVSLSLSQLTPAFFIARSSV